MENSKAYKYLIEQIHATDSKKLDGYYPKIIEEIDDWERDEVEDIIWNTFHKKNDTDLAEFMPKLQKHNGVQALERALAKCHIPSGASLNIAKALYEHTGDVKYLNVFKLNIDSSDNRTPIIAMLTYCKPSEELYKILSKIYINDENEITRSASVKGILYCKKYIKNPYDIQEWNRKLELRRLLAKDNAEERKIMLMKLESGELKEYCN